MSSPPKSQDATEKKKGFVDLINRGSRKPSPIGTTIFVGLRGLDPLLQYGILAKGIGSSLLANLGISQLPAGLASRTGTLIDSLDLSPYRLILLSMSIGSSAKHIFWLLGLSYEEFTPEAAVLVSVFNTLFNSLNTLLFTTNFASASLSSGEKFPQWPLILGTVAYVLGIGIETASEVQRRSFKSDPKNAGKPFTGGLFRYARHINYFGYTLWRTGFATAAAGFTAGVITFGIFLSDFHYRAVPTLDEYCTGRYGLQWQEFKQKTPFTLIPYVL